jgi:hypothetical protein
MAYEFNGTNQYLSVAAPVTAPPFTMSCWARQSTFTTRALLSIGQTNASSRHQLQINSSTAPIINSLWNNGSSGVVSPVGGNTGGLNPALSSGEWVNFACVLESSTLRRLFVRGIQHGSDSTGADSVATPFQTFTVGSRVGPAGFAAAIIAEVGIWSAALTAAEIASLAKGMTCDKVRPESLVFYAPLVRDLQDLSGGLTITNNNTATVATHPRVYA